MDCKTIGELIGEIKKEIENIWIDEPQDIFNIKNGYLGSDAGVYEQYFTPFVMLGGEMRCLGFHTFADLNDFSKRSEFTLDILKIMTKRMLEVDLGVISFFGLRKYGEILTNFNDLIDIICTKEEYQEIIKLMFTLTNRYQMWLHQIFPWGYCMFMKKKTPEDYKEIHEKLIKTY